MDIGIWMTPCKTIDVIDHHRLIFFVDVRKASELSLPSNQFLCVFVGSLRPPLLQILSFPKRDLTYSTVTPALNASQKNLFFIICDNPGDYGKTVRYCPSAHLIIRPSHGSCSMA